MRYPLFYPEGNKMKYGWCDNVPKVLDYKSLINTHFEELKPNLSDHDIQNTHTLQEKVNIIGSHWGCPDLKVDDFKYEQYVTTSYINVSMRKW